MKAWHAAWAAVVFLVPQASTAADDLPGAARELARKTSGFFRGPVAASYRNLSSLPDSELGRVRREFEAALPVFTEGGPAAEARFTLSENPAQFLLVEEIRKGEESQVWIAGWKRTERPAVAVSGLNLERRLIWEQDEPILDVAQAADKLVILTPSRITSQGNGAQDSVPLMPPKPWPRDVRGRLRISGGRLAAYLPGMQCSGSIEPALSVQCKASDEPWVLESGSRGILLGYFAADRNYFDGRVVGQNGLPKSAAPFYAAAAAEEQGNLWWLLTLVDGRTQVLDGNMDPVASFSGWGSDAVGISARCSGGSQVLATRPGDGNEPDAVQAFGLSNHMPIALAPAVTFGGPVTALWPSGTSSALAVARDAGTGKYAAYVLTMVCGP
ncbi:MAG TPA: hypothetical protein VKT49_05210 [Bryobacteraceae bacterium]|nr:hypothetical protein [Bryobacteraceae bacterium]